MTGVTIHEIDKGIDTGKIIDSISFKIPINSTAYENYKKYIINSSKKYQLEYLKKSNVEKNIDYMLSQQIIKEINRFFKTRPKNFTVKKKKKLFNKTIKLL